MLGQEYHLPDMLCIVRDLPVYRLKNSVGFTADGYSVRDVFRLERVDGGKDAAPTFFPAFHYIGASDSWSQFEFAVAEAIWLFTVGGEKVGKARPHITS